MDADLLVGVFVPEDGGAALAAAETAPARSVDALGLGFGLGLGLGLVLANPNPNPKPNPNPNPNPKVLIIMIDRMVNDLSVFVKIGLIIVLGAR